MLSLFEILKAGTVNGADCPTELVPIFKFLKDGLFPVIQIGIPIILIIMGSLDLGKAVLSSDDKEIKGATGRLIKRAIAAVAVFFITTLVSVLLSWVGKSGAEDANSADWRSCWTQL